MALLRYFVNDPKRTFAYMNASVYVRAISRFKQEYRTTSFHTQSLEKKYHKAKNDFFFFIKFSFFAKHICARGCGYGAEGLAYIAHSIHRGYLTFTV